MSLPDRLLSDLTLVKPAVSTNRWNDEERDYTGGTRSAVRGVVQQSGSSEQNEDDRAPISAQWKLLTNDLTVQPADRVEYAGRTFEVVSRPWLVERPGDGVHHLEASLRTVEG